MSVGSPLIASGTAGGATLGSVAGPIGAGVGGFAGGALTAAATGGTGAEIAGALDDNTFKIRQQMLGNRAQQIRDEEAHPWASTAGDFAADLLAFGPPSRALVSGAAKLGTAARWARGAMRFAPEESQALVSHGANALLGAGQSAAQQYSDSGTVDPATTLKAGAEGALLGNPGGTLKGLRGLRGAKPPVIAPSVQSPSSPPPPTTADGPWTERVAAGQDMSPAELEANVAKDRANGTLADKIAKAREQRRTGDVKIAQQAFKAKDQLTADQGEFVRQKLLADLAAKEQGMDPKEAEVLRTRIAALAPEELAQFRDDIAAREKAQADERTAAEMAPTTADLEQATIRKNVQNWKRPEIPVEQPVETMPAQSTADPVRPNTANELKAAFARGQITGSEIAPRPQKTRFSRPEDVGPDRGLPQEGPRTEAETLQDYLENRRAKYQTRPKSEAADAPTPEPAGVLAEAVRLAADPTAGKKAAFIPAGSPRPEVPAGMISLAHPKGEFLYNPAKMSAEEAARAVAGDQLDGQALGLGQKEKPAAPSDLSVVTDSNGQPAVMTEVVAGPEDIAKAAQAQQAAAPGSTQRVVPTEEVLAGREAGLSPLPAAAPRPPVDPAAARPASSLSPASAPVENLLLQDPKVQQTAVNPATAESIALGRKALDRRGFKYEETSAPIDEGRAAGSFEPATGDIKISKNNIYDTTYHHEGMHGQLQSLMLSKNPRERQFAIDLIAAHGEEPLAELGARASIEGSKENRFLRLVKDNWNWLRTTKLGGGDNTPERAARLLAESFDFDAPGAVPVGAGGVKFQPVTKDYEPVPNSVFAKADALYPGTGARLAAYEGTKAKHYGLFNSAIGELQNHGPLVDSVALKMQEAHATGQAPALTPEELPVYNRLTKLMQESAAVATAAGKPITPQANYFPHILNVPEARAYEKAPDAYLAAKTQEFVDWNLNNYGPAKGATPVEAAQYFKDYMHGVSSAPGSLGSDFGALNKSARQFGLPPSMREPSALNALHRYGGRYAVDLAKKQEILDYPDTANALGLGDAPMPVADQQAMKDAALHVNNALAQVGENPNGREAKDLLNAGRQLVHSATMQTYTAIRNQMNLAQHLVHMDKPEHFAQFITDTVRAATDYKDQYAKTLAMSVNKPGVDPSANVSDLAGQVASKLRGAATDLRKMTLGQFFENVSRVRNYTVAEGRARMDLALAATGDKSAQAFLDKFGAGVDTKQPFEEQVARVAKNYVDSMEGTYSGAGLPASVVNGGARSQLLRIQRYPIEQMSRAYQYTIRPIQKSGDYKPLLLYLFGSALNAVALQKFNQALSGGVSGLVSEDEAKAAGANPQKEMLLNLMDLAGTANLYGFAGNAAQAVSRNLRGQPQPIFGDPTVNYMTTTYKNLLAAVDAVKRGEPVVPSLLEAGRRIILEQMQMTRGLGEDKEQKGDKALKAKHAYLTDRKPKSAVEMGGGLLTGNTFNYQVPQISPTRDKAIAGDRQSYLALPPASRRRLDNYPGGYESTADEANLETWLAAAHPERLADYIHRRQAFKDRVHGRE